MGDHREIWLEPKCAENSDEGRTWCKDDAWGKCDFCDEPSVKYVRVDLAHIAGLKEALEIARRKKETNPGAVGVGAFVVMQAIEARIKEVEGQSKWLELAGSGKLA